MSGLLYRRSIPRYVLLKLLGSRFRGLSTGSLSLVSLSDVPDPKLPTGEWVRVAPILTGICGSDLATVTAKGTPYFAPMTSLPFVLGHEVVGKVVEVGSSVRDLSVGDRVVLHPALGCKVRGINPPCDHCKNHRDALCRNVTRGVISAGIQTGYCAGTGGGFSRRFMAHRSQLYRIPDSLDDRAAVLVEPFACALHGALRVTLGDRDTVLVMGCGAIGLLTIAALRASGCKARIVAVARYNHQREHAMRLGASELLSSPASTWERYQDWARVLNAEVLRPELGKPAVIGGADAVFDCVASSQSIDDCIRFTRSGGSMVLIGMPGMPRFVDWTPLWFKELTVHASYAYGPESTKSGTCDTFELAIRYVADWSDRLIPLVGKPFPLRNWREAFQSALNTGRSGVAKTVFAPNVDSDAGAANR